MKFLTALMILLVSIELVRLNYEWTATILMLWAAGFISAAIFLPIRKKHENK